MIKEILERTILYGKSGLNATCTKLSLPHSKLKELGFNHKNKDAFVAFTEDSVIIKRKPANFIRAIDRNTLENGILLFDRDYDKYRDIFINGVYEKTLFCTNKQYKPFYIDNELIGYEEL